MLSDVLRRIGHSFTEYMYYYTPTAVNVLVLREHERRSNLWLSLKEAKLTFRTNFRISLHQGEAVCKESIESSAIIRITDRFNISLIDICW